MQYDFMDDGLLRRLGRMSLRARGAMLGDSAGLHRALHRGASMEFAEYRNYVTGDDLRRVDWKAYARSDRYYIKEFEADTHLRAYFVIDASASMGYEGEGERKIKYAKRVAAHLAYFWVKQGDAVGLVAKGERADISLPAGMSREHLGRFFDQLNLIEVGGERDLADVLNQLASQVKGRACVYVLSDLFSDLDALGLALQRLRHRKHQVTLFHLLDPLELSFAMDQPYRFVGLEQEGEIAVDCKTAAEAYQQSLNQYLARVAGDCGRAQAEYCQVVTGGDFESFLRGFLTQSAR